MKYLFILGRNPELSIAELKGYFKRIDNRIIDFAHKENSVLAELENPLDADAVDFLGGTIAIGIVICRIKEIDRKDIYSGEKNNFNYAIWDYSDSTEEVSQYLKKRFRSERLKASEKKMRNDLSSQDSEKMQILTSKSVDEEYFVYDDLFGKIVQRCDYKKIEERDMKKPVRRESLSISPRLAKIMINLSQAKEGEIILDAFCGIGVILSEALNQEIKVIGIDRDENAIKGARENLKWFGFSESNFKLIKGDSSNTKFNSVRAMVSEPDFGETLKKLPSEERAKEMIRRYDNIMVGVLNNVKKYINGRIVFTSPYIKLISKKRIGCNLKELAEKSGLKLVDGFPISEFRENQVVGRQVVVFERN
jgi:tRNA G10  N-methylase Trm11